MTVLTADRLGSLAAAAVAAPSADNHHSCTLVASGDVLAVIANPELVGADSGRRLLGLIGVGAVIENLVLRAAKIGISLELISSPQGSDPTEPIAQFRCWESPAADNPLEVAIGLRHSNRRLVFSGPVLPRQEQQAFGELLGAVPSAKLVWLDSQEGRRPAIRLLRLAETERFRNPDLHRELFGSVRFDVGWDSTAAEGLPPGALELSRLERVPFRLLSRWSAQRFANLLGAHHVMAIRGAALPGLLAPHLCAIAVSGSDVWVGAINAGRALQRVWLRATTLGLSVQVLAASALYALDGFSQVPIALRNGLRATWSQLCPDAVPYAVLRMGRAKPPTVYATRPDPATMLRRSP